jgi:beta-lactamase class A
MGPLAPVAAAPPGASAAAVEGTRAQALDVSAPASSAAAPPDTTEAQQAPSATPLPTLRQWDTRVTSIAVDRTLVGHLDQALASVDGNISLAVKDLGSGRGAVLDGHRELQAASLFKLLVLYSVFEARLPLTTELLITRDALDYDLGTLELGVGESLSVAEALERMVTISDNASAIMLGSRVSASRITRNISALGMDSTYYSLDRMTTSAMDMLMLLEPIARGDAVSPAASSEMLHLLLRQRVNDRLPRLLPDDVRVAHKTGNLPGTVNDVGLVYGENSTVAVAVLISDTTNDAAAAAAIARVAQIAHAYFEEQATQSSGLEIPPRPERAVPPVWRQPRPAPPPATPTDEPLLEPEPTAAPARALTATPAPPTVAPTAMPPTPRPTAPSTATAVPVAPTATRAPTQAPTVRPTSPPTRAPTQAAPAKPTAPAKP